MVDIISITALIIAIFGAMGHFVNETHLQKCSCFCINSDCRDKKNITPSTSKNNITDV